MVKFTKSPQRCNKLQKRLRRLPTFSARDLHTGRTPRVKADGLTVASLCNELLNAKRRLMDTGEIQVRTFTNYRANCDHVVTKTFATKP